MRRHWCLLTAALKVCTLLSIASFAIASPLLTQINPNGIRTDNFLGQKLNGPSAFGKADLRITRVLGGGDGSGMDIALGKYKEKDAFIKCVAFMTQGREISGRRLVIAKEMKAAQMLIDAKTKLKGMEAVGRENVSEPHMFFGVPGAVCFVYSYDGATNLFQYAQPALLPQRIAFLQDVAKQMLLGVAYMHKVGLIHNDLKPENVMLSFPYPNNPTRPKATIIDFDLASPISYANGKIKPESDRSGTYPYHPPEVFRGIPADPTKKDTWSIGAIMYFLVTKKYLFPINNSSQFQQSVVNTMNAGFPSTQFQITPNAAANTALKPVIDTIKALLVPNPEQRPSPSSYLASLRRVSIPTRRLSGPRTV